MTSPAVATSIARQYSGGTLPRDFHMERRANVTPSLSARTVAPPAASYARLRMSTPAFSTHRYVQVNVSLRRPTNGELILAGMEKKRSITPSLKQRKDLGDRLTKAIERAGKTQAWVADQLNCTEAQISKMCKHGSGGMWAFAQACDVVGVSLDYVVLGTYPKADDWFMDKLRQLMATAGKPA